MSEITTDKKILTYLLPYGIGIYKEISDLIAESFPPEHGESFEAYKHKILLFLDDLERAKLIKYQGTSITSDKIFVNAAIQAEGIRFLESKQNPEFGSIKMGDGAQFNYHSPLSSNHYSNNEKTISKKPNKISKILKNWKLVIGIILGLLAIWKGCNALMKNDTEKTRTDSVKINAKDTSANKIKIDPERTVKENKINNSIPKSSDSTNGINQHKLNKQKPNIDNSTNNSLIKPTIVINPKPAARNLTDREINRLAKAIRKDYQVQVICISPTNESLRFREQIMKWLDQIPNSKTAVNIGISSRHKQENDNRFDIEMDGPQKIATIYIYPLDN